MGPFLRQIASGLMLVAVAAFLQQAALILVSQAAASTGSMPQPAVVLGGPVHYHDHLAGHIHAHAGDNAAGHVHGGPDRDHPDADDAASAPLSSLGCTSVVLPPAEVCAVPLDFVHAVARPDHPLEGIEPDGLSRPPSTPSIA